MILSVHSKFEYRALPINSLVFYLTVTRLLIIKQQNKIYFFIIFYIYNVLENNIMLYPIHKISYNQNEKKHKGKKKLEVSE